MEDSAGVFSEVTFDADRGSSIHIIKWPGITLGRTLVDQLLVEHVVITPDRKTISWKKERRLFHPWQVVITEDRKQEAHLPIQVAQKGVKAGLDKGPFIWDPTNGRVTAFLKAPKEWRHGFDFGEFSPDAKELSAVGRNLPRSFLRSIPDQLVWNTRTGEYRLLKSTKKLVLTLAEHWTIHQQSKILMNPFARPPSALLAGRKEGFIFLLRHTWTAKPTVTWKPVLIDVKKDRIVPRAKSVGFCWKLSGYEDPWSIKGRIRSDGPSYRIRLAPNGRLVRLPKYDQLPIAIVLNSSVGGQETGPVETKLGVVVRPFGYYERIKTQWLHPPSKPPVPLIFGNPEMWLKKSVVREAFGNRLLYIPRPIAFDILAIVDPVYVDWSGSSFAPTGTIVGLHLSPDGQWLVTSKQIRVKKKTQGGKTKPARKVVVEVWDLRPLLKKAAKKWAWATPKGLEKKLGHGLFYRLGAENWKNFEEESLTGCHEILISLANHPKEAVPMIEKWLGPPTTAKDLRKIPQWIKDLDSPRFAVRQKATLALKRLGLAAREAMKQAIKKPASLEQQSRLQQLLENIEERSSGKELALLRIVDALEYMNTPDSRRLLQKIAAGGYGAVSAEAAKSSLRLLSRR